MSYWLIIERDCAVSSRTSTSVELNLAEFDLPTSMISSFCHKVDENCVLLDSYAANSNFLLTFWVNLSVRYHYLLHNNPEERSSYVTWIIACLV
jgi:hypothetical protein